MKIAIRELLTLSYIIVIFGAVCIQGMESELSNSHKKQHYQTISKNINFNIL